MEQAGLLQQLRSHTQELEIRVAQRTYSLEQSLKFEKLLRQLAQLLRDRASEDCFLQVATTGLAGIFTPAIARKLAELQDGTISLESRFGEGSRFTICLPSLANPALGYRCDRP